MYSTPLIYRELLNLTPRWFQLGFLSCCTTRAHMKSHCGMCPPVSISFNLQASLSSCPSAQPVTAHPHRRTHPRSKCHLVPVLCATTYSIASRSSRLAATTASGCLCRSLPSCASTKDQVPLAIRGHRCDYSTVLAV